MRAAAHVERPRPAAAWRGLAALALAGGTVVLLTGLIARELGPPP
ncbi:MULTISPECIES: hypothetical protein [unclassified Parafrankia]|nr:MULTISPECIES: hypothetical protein [unclassified Parafrankia]SQD97314.1 hypothetical protein FMEAI12_4020043 [Parafrankia sp. Ea1.12]